MLLLVGMVMSVDMDVFVFKLFVDGREANGRWRCRWRPAQSGPTLIKIGHDAASQCDRIGLDHHHGADKFLRPFIEKA